MFWLNSVLGMLRARTRLDDSTAASSSDSQRSPSTVVCTAERSLKVVRRTFFNSQ